LRSVDVVFEFVEAPDDSEAFEFGGGIVLFGRLEVTADEEYREFFAVFRGDLVECPGDPLSIGIGVEDEAALEVRVYQNRSVGEGVLESFECFQ
jgi:hypothetical protein